MITLVLDRRTPHAARAREFAVVGARGEAPRRGGRTSERSSDMLMWVATARPRFCRRRPLAASTTGSRDECSDERIDEGIVRRVQRQVRDEDTAGRGKIKAAVQTSVSMSLINNAAVGRSPAALATTV